MPTFLLSTETDLAIAPLNRLKFYIQIVCKGIPCIAMKHNVFGNVKPNEADRCIPALWDTVSV